MPATHSAGTGTYQNFSILEAAEHYLSIGLTLVSMPYGSKAPNSNGWQHDGIDSVTKARTRLTKPQNIGNLHDYSRTAALDVDDVPLSYESLDAIALNLDDYLNAPTAKVKTAKGVKPIFRMPDGITLATKKLGFSHRNRETNKIVTHNIFELRGAGGHDVLPPSKHPSGIFYEWLDGYPTSRDDFLELPTELLNLWQKWDFYATIMQTVSPYLEVAKVERKKTNTEMLELIEEFNSKSNIADLLREFGYERK
jgi:Bifunctional DNA primase/polymerase, N-terminal